MRGCAIKRRVMRVCYQQRVVELVVRGGGGERPERH